ncbi:MAG TPA: YkgJ family cysteine cluster protein [Paucimonas sp.]|nr:YkgJ family cysteine cluster protein [Paucimonas sp.]
MSEQLSFSSDNPCLHCGACCANFRVSFYWTEAAERGLPDHLTEQVNHWYSCMAGTNRSAPRCQALRGEIGAQVACGVYPQRPSPCRELQAGDEKCNRARARHGLPAIPIMLAAA